MTSRLYGIKELNSQTLSLAEAMKFPKSVFFVKPDHFEVVDAINPHMLDDDGELHNVDFELAYEHWQELVEVYAGLGLKTIVLDGLQGCPDMVFCANQTFPYLTADGHLRCAISHMDNDVRKREVPSIQEQLEKLDIPADPLPEVARNLQPGRVTVNAGGTVVGTPRIKVRARPRLTAAGRLLRLRDEV